jgi:hypothetical protein
MPSVEKSQRTDGGFGMRRIVDLSRSIRITSEEIETGGNFEVWDRLYRAFDRKYLYDWYSRNHRRYIYGTLFIEVTAARQDILESFTLWSSTHGVRDLPARDFFRSATRDLTLKIRKRNRPSTRGGVNIEALGVAMWRSKKG